MNAVDPALVEAAAPECHEAVVRKGEEQPCEKPAVALRIDERDGSAYPVCARHTRKPMVPLTTVVASARAEADEAEVDGRILRLANRYKAEADEARAARDHASAEVHRLNDLLDAARAKEASARAVVAPGGPKCAACTYPDDFTSHAGCIHRRVLDLLGPVEDDWRWYDRNLRAAIRAILASAPSEPTDVRAGVVEEVAQAIEAYLDPADCEVPECCVPCALTKQLASLARSLAAPAAEAVDHE